MGPFLARIAVLVCLFLVQAYNYAHPVSPWITALHWIAIGIVTAVVIHDIFRRFK